MNAIMKSVPIKPIMQCHYVQCHYNDSPGTICKPRSNPETVFTTLHFLHNLQMGLISQCVCPLQAITPYYDVTLQLIGPICKLQRVQSCDNGLRSTKLIRPCLFIKCPLKINNDQLFKYAAVITKACNITHFTSVINNVRQ